MRNCWKLHIEVNTKSKEVIDTINDQNKESNVNLIILNLNKDRAINDELLNFYEI